MGNEEAPAESDPELDDLVVKNIGKIAMISYGEFEHDDFIDGLDRTIKYPDDAP